MKICLGSSQFTRIARSICRSQSVRRAALRLFERQLNNYNYLRESFHDRKVAVKARHRRLAVDRSGTRQVIQAQRFRPAALGTPLQFVQQVARSFMKRSGDFQVGPKDRWWDENTTAVITGGNRGIGKAVAQLIAQSGLKTIVTSRSESKAKEVADELNKITGSDRVGFEQLDISDASSVAAFAERIEKNHSNLMVLVNNAGMAFKGNVFGADEAQQTINTNFIGTKAVCEKLLPLIGEGGRIVNVCSSAGKERIIKDKALLQRFRAAKSGDDVEKLAKEFVSGIKTGEYKAQGWPASMYGVSKLCESTYTRVLAEQVGSKLDINACCPGYVDTDMTSHRGIKTPIQGADTPAWLALLAPKGTSGKFFSDRQEEPY